MKAFLKKLTSRKFLAALNSRKAYNFITKRLSTGSAWTKFRRPIYY